MAIGSRVHGVGAYFSRPGKTRLFQGKSPFRNSRDPIGLPGCLRRYFVAARFSVFCSAGASREPRLLLLHSRPKRRRPRPCWKRPTPASPACPGLTCSGAAGCGTSFCRGRSAKPRSARFRFTSSPSERRPACGSRKHRAASGPCSYRPQPPRRSRRVTSCWPRSTCVPRYPRRTASVRRPSCSNWDKARSPSRWNTRFRRLRNGPRCRPASRRCGPMRRARRT